MSKKDFVLIAHILLGLRKTWGDNLPAAEVAEELSYGCRHLREVYRAGLARVVGDLAKLHGALIPVNTLIDEIVQECQKHNDHFNRGKFYASVSI